MAGNKKVYGLILPKKGGQESSRSSSKFNVFGDDSDEEEKAQGPIAPYSQGGFSNKLKRQTQIGIDKALMEDPSVYEYDAIYDDIQAKKPVVGHTGSKDTKERKPKYIAGLLKAAEAKKREDERRKERQVQKEREAEGEMYADKESFVTSAYKKKMLEMQVDEEKERREAAIEALTDVTKQKDMSGFYRYLYRERAKEEDKPSSDVKVEVKEEKADSVQKEPDLIKVEQISSSVKEEPSSSSSSSSSASDSDKDEQVSGRHTKATFSKLSRPQGVGKFRKRKADCSSSEEIKKVDSSSEPESPCSHSKSRVGKDRRTHQQQISASNKRKESSCSPPPRSPSSQSRKPDRLRSSSPDGKRRRRSQSNEKSSRSESLKVDEQSRRKKQERESDSRDHTTYRGQRSRSRDRSHKKSRPSKAEQEDVRSKRNEEEENVGRLKGGRDVVEEVRGQAVDLGNSQDAPGDVGVAPGPGKENNRPDQATSVDPAKKVYPHHNSAKDIEEARKRYLQRKIARERQI